MRTALSKVKEVLPKPNSMTWFTVLVVCDSTGNETELRDLTVGKVIDPDQLAGPDIVMSFGMVTCISATEPVVMPLLIVRPVLIVTL